MRASLIVLNVKRIRSKFFFILFQRPAHHGRFKNSSFSDASAVLVTHPSEDPLHVAARKKIWERMVAMTDEESGIGAGELERLAAAELNERERLRIRSSRR